MAKGFPVSETAAYLVYVLPVGGDKFFHPQFGGRDEPIGLVRADAARRGKAAGLKSLKAGLRYQMGGQKGSVHFEIAVTVKKSPCFPYYPGPYFKKLPIH
jgi:hypothetical protein